MRNEGNIYYAEKGNFLVRKSDDFIMGEDLCLGVADSIDNYKEVPYTPESYKAFMKKYGVYFEDLYEEKHQEKDSHKDKEEGMDLEGKKPKEDKGKGKEGSQDGQDGFISIK